MGRLSEQSIQKLNEFVNSLPKEVKKMEAIASKDGSEGTVISSKTGSLFWKVKSTDYRTEGKKRPIQRAIYNVTCSICGYEISGTKGNIEKRKVCPGCAPKPAAVKTDDNGNCIHLCEIGTVEFIREFQEKHSVSEREAVRQFIDTVKASLNADDPVLDSITEESVRSSVRRNTGRKRDDNPKSGADRPKIQPIDGEERSEVQISTDNTAPPKSEKIYSQQEALAKVVAARKAFVEAMMIIRSMAESKRLTDDSIHKETENQIRLILTEAKIIGINIALANP
jgi:hypothetical protein